MKTTTALWAGEKLVYVTTYVRFRFGNWETVVSHFRRYPRS